MNMLRKSVISFGGVAAAAFLLAIASPRTVHALGEQLVDVVNTAIHPAIVEDVPHFASHLITLVGYVVSPSYGEPFVQLAPDGTVSTNAFVVPAGQSFVMTGIDITPSSNTLSWINIQNYKGGWYGGWSVQSRGTTEFQYPSGIVVESAATLYVSAGQAGTSVIVHGYLTPN